MPDVLPVVVKVEDGPNGEFFVLIEIRTLPPFGMERSSRPMPTAAIVTKLNEFGVSNDAAGMAVEHARREFGKHS